MKKLLGIAVCILSLGSFAVANAATLFTTPVISVTPTAMDFGAVPNTVTVTNTFLVENAGGGKLVGKVQVAPPFKIISGGSYRLDRNETQIVYITYTPGQGTNDTQKVTFSQKGATGTYVMVTGKPAPAPAPKQK
jgi:hypothetical protein